MVFESGDMLLAKGDPEAVQRMTLEHNLGIEPIRELTGPRLDWVLTRELGLAEVVIPPRSKLVDRVAAEATIAERFDVQVISLRRQNEAIDHRDVPLQIGDTLLIRGTWEAIGALRDDLGNFGGRTTRSDLGTELKGPKEVLVSWGYQFPTPFTPICRWPRVNRSS